MNLSKKSSIFLFIPLIALNAISIIFVEIFTIRVFAGLIQVVIMPGYFLLQILFPQKNSLNTVWRWSLVFPTSIALISLILLIFNYFFAYDYTQVIIVVSILNIIFLFGVFLRSRKVEQNGDGIINLRILKVMGTKQVVLFIIFISAIIFFIGSIVFANFHSKRTQYFTEFYILTEDKKIPFSVPLMGNSIQVKLGITNGEGKDLDYAVVFTNKEKVISKSEWIHMSDGENKEMTFYISGIDDLNSDEIDIFLVAEGMSYPYRSLKVFLSRNP